MSNVRAQFPIGARVQHFDLEGVRGTVVGYDDGEWAVVHIRWGDDLLPSRHRYQLAEVSE